MLLVEEAGGRVTDVEGRQLSFNRKETLVNGIIASSKEAYPFITDLIDRYECMDKKIAQCQ